QPHHVARVIEIDVLYRFIDQIDIPVLRGIGRDGGQAQFREPNGPSFRRREVILIIARVRIDQQQSLARPGPQRLSLSHRLDQCHRSFLHFCKRLTFRLAVGGYLVATGGNGGRSTPCPCGSSSVGVCSPSRFAASASVRFSASASALFCCKITGATPTSSGGIGVPITPQAATAAA